LSYTVLARRYRSSTFEDIIGQEPIARTLRNAIESDRTAHAYLFSGTRGVGKTSMARIFARELNSSEDLTQKDEISEAILRGEDLDVIEIDGASNRGVQEARDLIAASGLAPTRCKYRIYIIDEVHMLTTPAFNALLKTMEEPPSHVKFILCTTEPHKVPATIQSRCQRFDFRSIPSAKIATHLDFILGEEGIDAAPEVVSQVARLGNGSMRDALSILDRLLAGGVSTIKVDEMEESLGLPSQVAVTQLCDAVSNKDIQGALESADELLLSGISLDRVLEVVALTFRNALISKVCGTETELLELSDDVRISVARLGDCFDEATMTHLIALCDASSRQVRRGGSGRALFDATIARLCLVGEVAEAGSVLTSNLSGTEIKKKSIAPQVSRPPIVETVSEPPVGEPSSPPEVNWEALQSLISKTAGLKKITKYLVFSSLEDQKLTLSISDSGRDSVNYILAQRQKIEQMLTKELGIKFQVIIDASQQSGPPVAMDSSFEEVEEDELVKTARGLFDGTIVRVRSTKKDGT
jgi:DNA polymerase-3 subunit gamma/tau